MIKNEKKARIGKRLFTTAFVLCTMVVLMTLMALSVNATVGWTFGKANTPDGLVFTVNDTGIVSSLTKYNALGGQISGAYCTQPRMKFWIGNDPFTSQSTWGGTELDEADKVEYFVDGGTIPIGTKDTTPTNPSTWTNASQKQEMHITWNKTLAQSPNVGVNVEIKWIVRYNMGSSVFTHEWSVSSDEDIEGGLDFYYGGHHRLGGGSGGGYGEYNGINKAILTWGKPGATFNGMYMLRSDGAVEPKSYYSISCLVATELPGYPNATEAERAFIVNAPTNRIEYPNLPKEEDHKGNSHTCFYMHWPNEKIEILPANTVWKVEATEGIDNSGSLSVIAPPDRTVPSGTSGVTLTYQFTVKNFINGQNIVTLTPTFADTTGWTPATTWTATIDGKPFETITMTDFGESRPISVDVTIPGGLANGVKETLILTAVSTTDHNTSSGSTITTIDNSMPIISDVQYRNLTRQKMNVMVEYKNLPVGAHETTIEIYNENGRGIGTGEMDPYTKKIATISSGELVYDIDVSMLEVGKTYLIKASVKGIELPHASTKFTMVGDQVSGIVWRDMNEMNGIRQSHEGVSGIDFVLTEVDTGNIFETTSHPRGVILFTTAKGDSTISQTHFPGYEYKFEPVLDPYQYALTGEIVVTVGNDSFSGDLVAGTYPALDAMFEYFLQDGSGYHYKFKPGQSAGVAFEVQIAQSAVVEVRAHLGSDKTNLTDVHEVTIVSGTRTKNVSPVLVDNGVDSDYPVIASFPAYSNASISVTARPGYRMATRFERTETRDQSNLNPYVEKQEYKEWFEVIAGDVFITGITNTAPPNKNEPATQMTSNTERVEVTVTQSWAGATTRLEFDAWNNLGVKIGNPNRANYEWTIISNEGIIENLVASTGQFKFTEKTGKAVVRVTLISNTKLYHEIEINVDDSTTTYSRIYLALPSDIDTEITQISVLTTTPTEVVVVGIPNQEPGGPTPVAEKIRSSIAAITEIPTIKKLTISKKSGDLYAFNLTGITSGTTEISGLVDGHIGNTNVVDVLITNLPLRDARGIDIIPNPIILTAGETKEVKYILTFDVNPTANNIELPAKFVNAGLVDGLHASFSAPDRKVSYISTGTDTLTATLKLNETKKGTAPVICEDGLTPVDPDGGVLTLQEVTSTLTYGFIEQEKTAEYIAFFDKNNNGAYDSATETQLPYGTLNSTFEDTNGCFSIAAGAISVENVLLTGDNVGTDQLTVTYTYNKTTYTASTDIIVFTKGYAFDGIEVAPAITVMESEETTSFVVRGVFINGSLIEKQILPGTMYNGTIPTGSNVVSIVAGTENSVKAEPMQLAAEAVYKATLNKNTSATDEADILVIPKGATLEVSPNPLWIEEGTVATENINYELKLNGVAVNYPNPVKGLLYYVSTNITDKTIANFNNNDVTKVDGLLVGRTTLTAYLYGKINNSKIIKIYVWDDDYVSTSDPDYVKTGLKWDPDELVINSGSTKVSSVYLIDDQGDIQALVDLEDLDIELNDPKVVSFPTPTGTTLPVTAETVTVSTLTTITASPRGDNKNVVGSADLTVNVKSNMNVYGIKADPQVIEIWPGQTVDVKIIEIGTGKELDITQLNATTRILSSDNWVEVSTDAAVLEVTQKDQLASASVNIMTVIYEEKQTEVYIINHTADPYEDGNSRSMELNPDPVSVVRGSTVPGGVNVILNLYTAQGGSTPVDSIVLPPDIITWAVNTSLLPGRINIFPNSTNLDIYGVVAGAQTYRVGYSHGNAPLSVNGSVFVYDQDPNVTSAPIEFKFEPEVVVLSTVSPYNSASIRGVITYNDGTIQYIKPQEFPIAISNLTSSMENAATVSNGAIITSKNNISPDSFRTTKITGDLIGTSLSGETNVLVYDPNAELTIVSAADPTVVLESLTLWTPSGTPNDAPIQTKLGNDIVPNIYLEEYNVNNGNVTCAPLAADSQLVTAVSEGTSVITSLLKNTTKSDTVNVTIYDGSVTYSTITYDENGGTGTITSDYKKDGTYYFIKSPIGINPPTGMQFKEWNTQDDELGITYTINQQILVNGDLDLFAIWEPASSGTTYDVTYDANGGVEASETTNHNQGTYTVSGPTFTRPGYRFVKWNTQDDEGGTYYDNGDTFELIAPVTLYAVWVEEWTVTYDANGGTGTVVTETDIDGAIYTVLGNTYTAPTTSEQFKEWNEADDGSGRTWNPGQTFTLSENVTLYAIWVEDLPETFIVTYNANGGTGTPPTPPDTGISTDTHTVRGSDTFTRDGFTLIGWHEDKDALIGDPAYDFGETFLYKNVTLYAIWELIPVGQVWTVTYDSNGGSGTMTSDTNIPDGSAYTVKPNGFTAPTGDQFKNWNTADDESGTTYTQGQEFPLTGNLTLYAIWETPLAGTTYEVNYDANTGTGPAIPSDAGIEPGTDYPIRPNTFTKTDHIFKGWNTQADGSGISYADEGIIYGLGSDLTLYAVWELDLPGTTYRVDYYPNGGSGDMAPDTNIPENSQHTLKTNTFTAPANKQFKEWNTAANGSGTTYANGATIDDMTSDLKLYAIWETIPTGTTYKVTYNANGGRGLVPRDTREYAPGDEVTVMGQGGINRSGYTFVGWSLNSNGSGTIYEATDPYTINSNTTFYAVWEESTTPTPPTKYKLTVQTTSGGTVNSYVSGYYSQGDRINIIATPNRNSSFIKWTSSINGVVLSPSMPTTTVIMPASDVVVTAQFTSPSSSLPIIIGGGVADGGATGVLPIVAEKYKVTYKANGGSGKDYVVSGLASSTIHDVLNVEDTQISYSKRIFTGWNTEADGSGKDYMPVDSILIIEDVILYAQWNTKVELKKDDHITYLNGYTDGTVKPDNAITRAEATSIFYRLLEKQGTVTGGKFSDVKNGEWYAEAINYLASVGIATGYDDGTYAPNKPITRAEFTVMAAKFEDMVASSDNITFSDIPKTHVAYNYINSGVTRGWISGFPDGTFKPDDSITRAQVVKIINAMLDRKIDSTALAKVENPYTDLDKSHWAYSEIIEASIKHDYTRDENDKEIWK